MFVFCLLRHALPCTKESQLRGFLSRDLANLTNRTVPAYVDGLESDSLLILIYAGPKFESLDIVTKKLERARTLVLWNRRFFGSFSHSS